MVHRLISVVCCGLLLWGVGTPLFAQAPEVTGYRDFPFRADGVVAPTGQKPESKLWFHDDLWWGSLFDVERDQYMIFRLEPGTQVWQNTGVVVDERNSAHMDCLWDGTRLYIASSGSHKRETTGEIRLLRFSYDAAQQTYTLDPDFPVILNPQGSEAVVIAKDGQGMLWATFTRGSQVHITHSSGDEAQWVPPYPLPFMQAANLDEDDISTVVAFGDQIGILWSNQTYSAIYFALHPDGASDDVWSIETVLNRWGFADDHLNVKVSADGEVYTVAKTSLNDVTSNGYNPLILVLKRDNQGQWSEHVFGRVLDDHTRPIILLDEVHRLVYVFAVSPCCSGGIVYYKRSLMDYIAFSPGLGTPFIESYADTHINNPTSTKQNLGPGMELLVQASDYQSGYYLHGNLDLAPVCVASSPRNLNLRAGPGTDYAVLGAFRPNTSALIAAHQTGTDLQSWWKLSSGEWVRSDLVSVSGPCDSVPLHHD